MARWITRRPLVAALLLSLIGSLAGNVLLYRKASRPLFDDVDRPLIERTIAEAGARTRPNSAKDIRAQAFPIVMHRGDQACVELRRYDGRGYIGACYDRRGRLIEETAGVTD